MDAGDDAEEGVHERVDGMGAEFLPAGVWDAEVGEKPAGVWRGGGGDFRNEGLDLGGLEAVEEEVCGNEVELLGGWSPDQGVGLLEGDAVAIGGCELALCFADHAGAIFDAGDLDFGI